MLRLWLLRCISGKFVPCFYANILCLLCLSGYTDRSALAYDDIQIKQPAVAYQPREYSPIIESSSLSHKKIRSDLQLLFETGFRSLVTYSSEKTMGDIPEIARKVGFSGSIIMGVWDPFSSDEWDNVIRSALIVDGYCVGNEGLGVRYTPEELAVRMKELRRMTGKPVTTSEPIDAYISGPYRHWLLHHSDWLFPIAHPYWAEEENPEKAVDWITARYNYLTASSGRKVVLKEAGYPTIASSEFGEDHQLGFFRLLESKGISFFYFEAFDQSWKGDTIKEREVEAHWGLYQIDGTPKKVIPWITENGVNRD